MASEPSNQINRRAQKFYRAPAVTVFFVVCLILWLLHRGDGAGGWRQLLRFDLPSLESFLTSHLLHTSGLHLVMNALVVLLLGMILESRWGTLRFLVFYFLCAWGGTAFSLGMAWLFHVDGYTCGASSVALGCLVSIGVLYPEARLVRWMPANRFLVWVGVFVVCAMFPLVKRPPVDGAEIAGDLYLLPQAVGVPLALLFVSLLPRFDGMLVRRQQRLADEERRRLREIRTRVDRLLEKISAEGYESLSPDELHFLRDASKHYRDVE